MNPDGQFARGGAKPSMLATGSRELTLNVGTGIKRGLYQLSPDGKTLARLVELPTWLSDVALKLRLARKHLLDELSAGSIRNPADEIGESRGHILINAAHYTNLTGSCVGMDVQILDKIQNTAPRQIMFFVFRIGYTLHERWKINWADFMSKSVLVEAEEPFMPQRMVSVRDLQRI